MLSREIGPILAAAPSRVWRDAVKNAVLGDTGTVVFAAASAAATGGVLMSMQRGDGTFGDDDLLSILVGTGATTWIPLCLLYCVRSVLRRGWNARVLVAAGLALASSAMMMAYLLRACRAVSFSGCG